MNPLMPTKSRGCPICKRGMESSVCAECQDILDRRRQRARKPQQEEHGMADLEKVMQEDKARQEKAQGKRESLKKK